MSETIVAIKSVKQAFSPTPELLEMMETFRRMVNDCIRIGIDNDISTMKSLSMICYSRLAEYRIYANYKICAIQHASIILRSRKKSIKRGLNPKIPHVQKPVLKGYLGFKIIEDHIVIPLTARRYFQIKLDKHICQILSRAKPKWFRLFQDGLSISYSQSVSLIPIKETISIDRNLNNITVGNYQNVVQYNTSKAINIGETTTSILRSFKRNDVRIQGKLFRKYGQRRKNRVSQLLHHVSKDIVRRAKVNNQAIVLEDIRHVRQSFSKGNFGKALRRQANTGWPYYEIKRQIEYKAAWEGVKTITVSKADTRYSSTTCPQCGERLQEGKERKVWCAKCQRWMDRDVVAVMNLSYYGRAWFARSEGLAVEAMKGNPEAAMPVILRVDASKLSRKT